MANILTPATRRKLILRKEEKPDNKDILDKFSTLQVIPLDSMGFSIPVVVPTYIKLESLLKNFRSMDIRIECIGKGDCYGVKLVDKNGMTHFKTDFPLPVHYNDSKTHSLIITLSCVDI